MTLGRLIRLSGLFAITTALYACAGNSTSSLPQTPQGQCAQPAATSDDVRFNARDDFDRPIAHTHVLRSVMAPDTSDSPCAVAHAGGALRYHGGTVQTTPAIYVVFWGFQTYGDPMGEAARLSAFLNAVGASSWLNTVTQYYQSGPTYIANPASQLSGTWYDDSDPIPPHPNDRAVKAEAVRLAQHFGVSNSQAAFIVATATHHSIKGFPKSYCAYHGSDAGGQVNYTNLPYQSDAGQSCGANSVNSGAAGKIDGVTIVGGHEVAETQTDPTGGGWYDAAGNEIADKCAWRHLQNTSFGSFGAFPTQPLFSNSPFGCLQ